MCEQRYPGLSVYVTFMCTWVRLQLHPEQRYPGLPVYVTFLEYLGKVKASPTTAATQAYQCM